jgi:hypothetical protein
MARGNREGGLTVLVRCIARCLLRCLECCVSFVSRYALIYCAVFGVPFKEGCRRWVELECHRFVDVLMGGVCINQALTYNSLVFTVGTGMLGYGLGYAIIGKQLGEDEATTGLFIAIFAALFTFAIFAILSGPVLVSSDALLVCFAEVPDRLESSAHDLYVLIEEEYTKALQEAISWG